MKKLNFLENIIAHFRTEVSRDYTERINLYNDYLNEHDYERAQSMLHVAKSDYINPLAKALNKVVRDKKISKFNKDKVVISNADVDGYNVVVGAKTIKNDTVIVLPYLTITLSSKSIDDMTLTLTDIKGSKIQEYPIKNFNEYKIAENNICSYILYGHVSWILRNTESIKR